MNIIDMDFSDGFIDDMKNIMEICVQHNSDHCTVTLPVDNAYLDVILTFDSLRSPKEGRINVD